MEPHAKTISLVRFFGVPKRAAVGSKQDRIPAREDRERRESVEFRHEAREGEAVPGERLAHEGIASDAQRVERLGAPGDVSRGMPALELGGKLAKAPS
jgi:hypothetical protein